MARSTRGVSVPSRIAPRRALSLAIMKKVRTVSSWPLLRSGSYFQVLENRDPSLLHGGPLDLEQAGRA